MPHLKVLRAAHSPSAPNASPRSIAKAPAPQSPPATDPPLSPTLFPAHPPPMALSATRSPACRNASPPSRRKQLSTSAPVPALQAGPSQKPSRGSLPSHRLTSTSRSSPSAILLSSTHPQQRSVMPHSSPLTLPAIFRRAPPIS